MGDTPVWGTPLRVHLPLPDARNQKGSSPLLGRVTRSRGTHAWPKAACGTGGTCRPACSATGRTAAAGQWCGLLGTGAALGVNVLVHTVTAAQFLIAPVSVHVLGFQFVFSWCEYWWLDRVHVSGSQVHRPRYRTRLPAAVVWCGIRFVDPQWRAVTGTMLLCSAVRVWWTDPSIRSCLPSHYWSSHNAGDDRGAGNHRYSLGTGARVHDKPCGWLTTMHKCSFQARGRGKGRRACPSGGAYGVLLDCASEPRKYRR